MDGDGDCRLSVAVAEEPAQPAASVAEEPVSEPAASVAEEPPSMEELLERQRQLEADADVLPATPVDVLEDDQPITSWAPAPATYSEPLPDWVAELDAADAVRWRKMSSKGIINPKHSEDQQRRILGVAKKEAVVISPRAKKKKPKSTRSSRMRMGTEPMPGVRTAWVPCAESVPEAAPQRGNPSSAADRSWLLRQFPNGAPEARDWVKPPTMYSFRAARPPRTATAVLCTQLDPSHVDQSQLNLYTRYLPDAAVTQRAVHHHILHSPRGPTRSLLSPRGPPPTSLFSPRRPPTAALVGSPRRTQSARGPRPAGILHDLGGARAAGRGPASRPTTPRYQMTPRVHDKRY